MGCDLLDELAEIVVVPATLGRGIDPAEKLMHPVLVLVQLLIELRPDRGNVFIAGAAKLLDYCLKSGPADQLLELESQIIFPLGALLT